MVPGAHRGNDNDHDSSTGRHRAIGVTEAVCKTGRGEAGNNAIEL